MNSLRYETKRCFFDLIQAVKFGLLMAFALWAPLTLASPQSGGVQNSTMAPRSPIEPILVTIDLTTPTQEVFTIETISGASVSVANSASGEEYMIYVESLEEESSIFPFRHGTAREWPNIYSIQLFRALSVNGQSGWELVSEVERLVEGREFVEPVTGFALRPRRSRPLGKKEIEGLMTAGGQRILCCVDCGSFTICGARVSGCGLICNNCNDCFK